MKVNKLFCFIVAGVIAIGVLWVGSWILIDCCIEESSHRGEFGDKFGAINSLFSGLAFLGLIVTLLFQKEELELQRQELAETRKELEGQKKEFEEQNKIMRRQSFENTLFSMISLQQEIVNKLFYIEKKSVYDPNNVWSVKTIMTDYSGRNVFEKLYNEIIIKYVNINGDIQEYNGIKSVLRRNNRMSFPQIKETTLFDHYFRHLYRIFKFIYESKLVTDMGEKYNYACIVRSQLSDYELVMLFYNCISINGKDKFKPLVEEYAIFNNLRKELLIDSSDISYYNKSAYNYISHKE